MTGINNKEGAILFLHILLTIIEEEGKIATAARCCINRTAITNGEN
jgi:hypothetical protein